ncbi:MAG: PAS domain-containing protein, partial [Myxococcales bacterium]|nr:PAS domain-containing protein [Myxococcales bacterium]
MPRTFLVVGGLVSLALVLVPVGERLGVGYITGFSFGSAGHVLVEGLSVAAAAFTGLALLYEYEIDAEGSAATLLLGLAFLGSAALEAIHAGHSLGRPSPTDSYEGWLATGVYPALMLTVGSEVSRRWNAGQRRLGLPALAAVLILASWALPPFGDATCVGLVALAFILLQLRHRACSSTIDDALRWVLAPALAAQLAMVVATKDYGLGFGAAHMLRWIAYALPLGALAQHHAQARGQLARALRRAERAARSRRRTMQRLRERDEQLALALGAGSTTTWHYSVEHRRFEGDGQIRSLLGRGASGPRYAAKDELIELIHPEDRPFFRQALAAALSDGDPLALYVRVRGDHGDRHLSLRGSAVRRGDGSVGALIGVCQDVTAEKEAADERRRREARLISFLEALPVGVFVVEAGGPVFANRMAMELTPQVFDFRPGDAWSRVLDVRRAKSNERYPEKELPLVVAWKRGRGLADDLVVQRQGQDVPIAMWANREESASGTQFVIVVVEDVSDRKGLEAQLFHARKLEAVGRLSAG